MFNSPIIEIFLSLTFTYFVLSITASSIYEWFGKISHRRGRFLQEKLLAVFEASNESEFKNPKKRKAQDRKRLAEQTNPNWSDNQIERTLFLDEIYQRVLDYSCIDLVKHSWTDTLKSIRGLAWYAYNTTRFPKEIKSDVFTSCMMDYLLEKYEINKKIEVEKQEIEKSKDLERKKINDNEEPIKKQLRHLKSTFKKLKDKDRIKNEGVRLTRFWIVIENIISNSKDMEAVEQSITKWYEDYSKLIIKKYGGEIKPWLFSLGLIMAVFFNVDSIHIAKTLWEKDDLRKQVVNGIDQHNMTLPAFMDTSSNTTSGDVYRQMAVVDSSVTLLKNTDIPIGWSSEDFNKTSRDTTLYYNFKFESNYLDSIIIAELLKYTVIGTKFNPSEFHSLDSLISFNIKSKEISAVKLFENFKKVDQQQYLKLLRSFQNKSKTLNLTDNFKLQEASIVEEYYTSVPVNNTHLVYGNDSIVTLKIPMSSKKDTTTVATFIPQIKADSGLGFEFKLKELNFDYYKEDTLIAMVHQLSHTGISIRLDVIRNKEKPSKNWFKKSWSGIADFWFWDYINKLKVLGWIITAIAIAMGAPFWYDVLKGISSMRKTKPKT
jgi:hypothetical protein